MPLQQDQIELDDLTLTVKSKHFVAVEIQQSLDLGNQTVQPDAGYPEPVRQGDRRHRPSLTIQELEDPANDLVFRNELADHLSLCLVGARPQE